MASVHPRSARRATKLLRPQKACDGAPWVTNPHDKLFKSVFGEPQHAASHFALFLPREVAHELDLNALKRRTGSFVDEDLRERHTDLLYEVPFRDQSGSALVYILFEHQSSSDPLMPLRLLRYMLRIWDTYIEAEPGSRQLPPVLPIVLYHNRGTWGAPRCFHDLLGGPEEALSALHAYLPQFSFILNDLSVVSDEELRAGAMDGVVRLLFKHIWDGDLPSQLASWGELLRTVASKETAGLRSLSRVIEYILQASDVPIDVLERVLTSYVDPSMSETIQTTADQLRQEGRQEGRLEGCASGILRVLEARTIQVDDITRTRILGCRDQDRLERWFDRALIVKTVSELFLE